MDDIPPFLTPSYLRSSRHLHRLQTARLQELSRLTPPSSTAKPPSTASSATNLTRLPSTYRSNNNLVHDVIERLPPPSPSLALDASLPTSWSLNDAQSGLEILAQGTEVRFNGITKTTDEAASVRSDYPIPKECGIYYFEVTILSRGKEGQIGVGFSSRKAGLNRLPGWESESWAYHGDDGFVFACTAQGKAYGPKFGGLDTVGCGVEVGRGRAFFTRNGVYQGTAFTHIKAEKLYPSVGMKKPGEHLRVNFGQTPFIFDIDSHVESERRSVLAEISKTSPANLHPPDTEDQLIHNLIGQYLAHEGYVETAKAFSADIQTRQESLEGGEKVGTSLQETEEEDIHAVNRQRIRRCILDGDLDRAQKFVGSWYPRLWEEDRNRDVYFRLRCRGFVEMIRRLGEVRKQQAAMRGQEDEAEEEEEGEGEEEQDTQMELDDQLHREERGDRDDDHDMPDSDSTSHHRHTKMSKMKATALEQAALEYGTELSAEFGNDQRPEVQNMLRDCFAVLAYESWEGSPMEELFGVEGRVGVAEGVNGAVLVSLGKPSSAALERVCAQTEALLDECAGKNGGAGAFVCVQRDFLRD